MAYPSNTSDDVNELENMEAPAEAPAATLANVVLFATRHSEIKSEIATMKEYLSTLEKESKDIEEQKIPQILNALGMNNFGLKDGSKVVLETAFQGSVVVEDPELRKKQLAWLIANEGQDTIKNVITCEFVKGKDAEAKALRDILEEYGFVYTVAESVHAGTLGSFIKSKVEAGAEVPLEELHWRVFNKVKFKAPAKKKTKGLVDTE